MNDYIVRPKGSSKINWSGYERACLGISLGNANERGEKLHAIVHWLNSTFKEVVIDLSDALYRWNEYDDHGELAINGRDRAIAKGDQWLVENGSALTELTIPYKVARWSTWLIHKDFFSVHHQIREIYNSHGDFSQCMNIDIQRFMNRRKRLGLEINPTIIQNCLNFLFEEITVHTLRFRTLPNTMQVYPGDDLSSMNALRQGSIPNAPEGLKGVPLISLRIEKANQSSLVSAFLSLSA